MLNSFLWFVIWNRYQFPDILPNGSKIIVARGVRVLSDMFPNQFDVFVTQVAHVESFSVSKGFNRFVLAPEEVLIALVPELLSLVVASTKFLHIHPYIEVFHRHPSTFYIYQILLQRNIICKIEFSLGFNWCWLTYFSTFSFRAFCQLWFPWFSRRSTSRSVSPNTLAMTWTRCFAWKWADFQEPMSSFMDYVTTPLSWFVLFWKLIEEGWNFLFMHCYLWPLKNLKLNFLNGSLNYASF